MNDNEKVSATYSISDPLGALRAYARELWKEAGSPSDRSWESYLPDAEKRYLGERESAPRIANPRAAVPKKTVFQQRHAEGVYPPKSLIALVAESIEDALSAREAHCLARILSENRILLRNGESMGPFSDASIAELLAHLAAEYDEPLASAMDGKDPESLSLAIRTRYWEAKLLEQRNADAPLNYLEQNSLRRLQLALLRNPRVMDFQFLPGDSRFNQQL